MLSWGWLHVFCTFWALVVEWWVVVLKRTALGRRVWRVWEEVCAGLGVGGGRWGLGRLGVGVSVSVAVAEDGGGVIGVAWGTNNSEMLRL